MKLIFIDKIFVKTNGQKGYMRKISNALFIPKKGDIVASELQHHAKVKKVVFSYKQNEVYILLS